MIDSLYIHYPFCRHLCNYCDFYKLKQTESNRTHQQKLFQDHLSSSLRILQENVHEPNGFTFGKLKTLYIGGGTPSLLGLSGVEWLLNFLKMQSIQFDLNPGELEFTLEIDPGTVNEEMLKNLKAQNVNRFSFGLQTLNEGLIDIADRKTDVSDIRKCLSWMKDLKVNYSVDFLLGIPKSQKRNVIKELEEILLYGPSHISLYILNPKTNYPLKNFMPEDEQVAKEYLDVHDFLVFNGFRHYEVSNYARPGFEGRHNLGYWGRRSSAALGPSAAGLLNRLDDGSASEFQVSKRYQWASHLKAPQYTLESLTMEQIWLEQLYLETRLDKGFTIQSLIPPNIKDASREKYLNKVLNTLDQWIENQQLIKNFVHENVLYQFTSHGWVVLDSLIKKLI